MSTSKLLIDEDPILILPSLAVLIGLNESVFVQQLHYWTRIAEKTNSGKVVDGRRWVYKTLAEWRAENFPFWSERTIQTIVSNLRRIGAIDAEPLANDSRDRTNFYAINYAWLRAHDAESASSDDEEVASCSTQKLRSPNKTETTSETTTEKAREKKTKVLMPLPDWLPDQEWSDFQAMRQEMGVRGKLTAKAAELVIAELDKLRAAGNDPAEVLRQSVMNNWRGVFALKTARTTVSRNQSVNDQRMAELFGAAADPMTIEMENSYAKLR